MELRAANSLSGHHVHFSATLIDIFMLSMHWPNMHGTAVPLCHKNVETTVKKQFATLHNQSQRH
jgi:hypothetical protein